MRKLFWFLPVFGLILLVNCKGNTKNLGEANAMNSTSDLKVNEASQIEKQVDSSLTNAIAAGKKVYSQNCVVCHQASGGGVPNLNPPLKGTEYVLGNKARLIKIILKGSSEGLEIEGRTYSNNMPGFESLKNSEIANVLTYVRNSFENSAARITENEVKAVRDSIK